MSLYLKFLVFLQGLLLPNQKNCKLIFCHQFSTNNILYYYKQLRCRQCHSLISLLVSFVPHHNKKVIFLYLFSYKINFLMHCKQMLHPDGYPIILLLVLVFTNLMLHPGQSFNEFMLLIKENINLQLD